VAGLAAAMAADVQQLTSCPPAAAGEVLYWDLVSEQVVGRFKAHAGVVTSLAVHPQGELLLTCATDGLVKVWRQEGQQE
jgi:WD40 repeat protein